MAMLKFVAKWTEIVAGKSNFSTKTRSVSFRIPGDLVDTLETEAFEGYHY